METKANGECRTFPGRGGGGGGGGGGGTGIDQCLWLIVYALYWIRLTRIVKLHAPRSSLLLILGFFPLFFLFLFFLIFFFGGGGGGVRGVKGKFVHLY